VVLKLEGDTKCAVRLFDLPVLDTKALSSKGDYYFGGILSKVDRDTQGVIEVTLTYSNLSEVAGRFYSRQAREFAERTQEIKQRNQTLLGTTQAPVPAASPSPPEATAPPKAPAPPTPTAAPEPTKKSNEAADDSEPPQPRNRPVLKRRNRGDGDPAATESSETGPAATSSSSPPPTSPTTDDDVVVYRRRDGSRRSSAGSSSASQPVSTSEESSDRPVLRRSPGKQELAREVDGMVSIPEGYITLGSDEPGDPFKPVHRVRVKAFYIDKREVTNEEYKQFCDATGHRVPPYWQDKIFPKGLEKYPVVQVSWFDASDYARWAGKRLPTEAEWERAARGPNSYRYSYGNNYDAQKANTGAQKTAAVGSHPPNEFGLFDMTGNASEWTSSLFLPYPYSASDGREDPKTAGPRTVRGGDFSSTEREARCLVRQKELPDHGSPMLGFRCARDAS
jgi:iron(II)-dependent oxidoreductase